MAARRPLIYAGQGVFYADACKELLEFAEMVEAPVITTLKAKSVIPENHPLCVGVRGAAAEHFLLNSDLIFAIGSSLSPNRFSHAIPNPESKVIIQSTVDELDLNRPYACNHAILGDAKLVLKGMIEEAEKKNARPSRNGDAVRAEVKHFKEKLIHEYMSALTSNEVPINPYRVYWDLMNTIDRGNSSVTHESGNTRDQSSTIYESLIPHGYIGWGNVSTLGFGLGAAVGAKLAFPDRQVVCIAGDAGVGYQMGNYEMLVR
ncbi:MAG: thiamine pyrophosphate-dependent enzyme, partial [Candidatus Bathyarchaeia archaeon]